MDVYADAVQGMKVGLIDVDGHHFPNLALMRISAYYKQAGAEVEWWKGNLFYYDIVFKSKIFSDAYSVDDYDVTNARSVVRGGTGYSISTENGREKFNRFHHADLPIAIERMRPDYSIYPEYDFAVAMTSRGCPRGCPFCIVAAKEGNKSVKVANVEDFYRGQKRIEVLDPNITACDEKHELFEQYIETGAEINFSQGLDIRMLAEEDIEYLNKMKLHRVHFAWDNPKEDLTEKFKAFTKAYRVKDCRRKVVYCLTNYNSTMEENLHRIYTLRGLGFDPYVMIYNKPSAPKEIKMLQRWCNSKWIFKSCKRFEDYNP